MLNQHALIGSRLNEGTQHYTMFASYSPPSTLPSDVVWLPSLDANGTFQTPYRAPFSLFEALDKATNVGFAAEMRHRQGLVLALASLAGTLPFIGAMLFVTVPHVLIASVCITALCGLAVSMTLIAQARGAAHSVEVAADLMQGAEEIRRNPDDRDPIEDHRIYSLSHRAPPLFCTETKAVEEAALEYMAEYNRIHGDPGAMPRS